MNKPKIEDFNFKSIKLLNSGGAEIEWSYMFSVGNEAHGDYPKVKRTLNVHKDLFDLLNKQKGNILLVEEINYRSMAIALEKMGVDNQNEVSQVVEGMTLETMSKIIVTGIKLSGREDKKNAVITYKKITGDKKIAGRATTAILLAGNTYGFEQELESDIEEIINEVYEYLYENKHSDSDQTELQLFMEPEKLNDSEERGGETTVSEEIKKVKPEKKTKKPAKKLDK